MTNTPEVGAIVLIEGGDGWQTGRVARGRRGAMRVELAGKIRELDARERWCALPLRAATWQSAQELVQTLRATIPADDLRLIIDALDGNDSTISAIASTLFGAITPENRAATLIALLYDKENVRVDGHTVHPLNDAERTAYTAAQQATRMADDALAEMKTARTALLTFGRLDQTPSQALVTILEAIARGQTAPNGTWERALVSTLGRSGGSGGGSGGGAGSGGGSSGGAVRGLATGAARALADLKIWDGHEDLGLLRSGLLAPWPAAARQGLRSTETNALPSTLSTNALPTDALPTNALPTCPLPLRAIDGIDPDEVDDALYAERVGDDIRLVVAIASPSLWLKPNSPADLEARRRGVTLYHPRHTSPMLPDELLTQCSLEVGQARPALVCEMLIATDGSRTLERIYEAEITLAEALVYDDVETSLADPPPWLAALREATERCEAWRIRNGAYLLYRPDIEVRAPPNAMPTLRAAPQSSMARRLVAESMVQACAAVGDHARAEGILLPFRSQQIRSDPPLPPGFYVEPADVQSMLGHLGPARTSSKASRHDILGVNAYVQVSSPLRRYPDLLAHYQIIAWLRGRKLPFDRGQLDSALKGQRSAVREKRAVGRRGQRYFQLLSLAREGLGAQMRAQVIRAGGPLGRSVAFDVERVLQIDLPGYLGPVGTWLDLEVVSVDASDGKLEVQQRTS